MILDQLYYESGYIDQGYFVYTANGIIDLRPYIDESYLDPDYFEYRGMTATLSAELTEVIGELKEFAATLTSVIDIQISAVKSVGAVSTMSAAFSQQSTISHIEGADLFAFSEAAIAVTVDRIRDNNASVNGVFTVAADVTRIRDQESDANTVSTAEIDASRSRDYGSQHSAAFSLAGHIDGILEAEIVQSSESGLIADVTAIFESASVQSSESGLTCTISHILGVDIVANNFATVSIDASRTRSIISDPILSEFSDSIAVNVISDTGSDPAIESNVSILPNTIAEGVSTQSTEFNLQATISHIEGADLIALSDAALTALNERIRDNLSDANTVTSLSSDPLRIKQLASDMTSDSTEVSTSDRIRGFDLDLVSDSVMVVSIDGILQAGSTLLSESQISCTISHIHGADLVAFSDGTMTVDASVIGENIIDADSSFVSTSIVSRIRDLDISTAADSLLSSAVSAVRDGRSDAIAESNSACDVEQIFGTAVLLASSGTLSATANFIGNASSNPIGRFNIFTSRFTGTYRPRNLLSENNFSFSDSIKKFGTHSVQIIPGSNVPLRYFRTISNPDLDLIPDSNQNFVIEAWFYFVGPISTNERDIFSSGIGSDMSWRLYWRSGSNGGDARFQTRDNNGNIIHTLFSPKGSTQASNQWIHLLVVKNSQAITLYQDGVSSSLSTSVQNLNLNFYRSPNPSLRVGSVWSSNNPYIDEVSYHLGTTLGFNPTQSTITVPTEKRQNTENTMALYHFDNDLLDDISLLQTANSNMNSSSSIFARLGQLFDNAGILSSASTLAAIGDKVRVSEGSLTSGFTQTTIIDKIIGVESDFNTSSTSIIDANKISLGFINVTGLANTQADVQATKIFIANIESQTEVSAIISHIHGADIIANGFAELAVTIDVIRTVDSIQTSFTSITTDGNRFRDNEISAISEFTQDTEVQAIFSGNSTNSALFTQEIQGNRIRFITDALDSEFTQESIVNYTAENSITAGVTTELAGSVFRIQELEIATESVASKLTIAVKVGSVIVDMPASTIFEAEIIGTFEGEIDIASESTLVGSGTGRAQAQANFISESVQVTIPEATKPFDSDILSGFSISASGTKDTDIVLDINSLSNQTIDIDKFTGISSAIDSESTQTITQDRIRDNVCDQTSDIAASIDGNITGQGVAILASNAIVSCTISHILGADIIADNFASLDVIIQKISSNTIDLESTTNLTALISPIRDVSSDFNSEFAQNTLEDLFKAFDCQMVSDTAQITDAVKDVEAIAIYSSESTLSCTISHILGADIVADNFATLTAEYFVGKVGFVDTSSESQLTAAFDRSRDNLSTQISDISLVGVVQRIRDNDIVLEAATVIDAAINGILAGEITATADTSLSCTISHILGADLVAFSDAAVIADAEVVRSAEGTLISTAAQNVTAMRMAGLESDQESIAVIDAQAMRMAGLEANLESSFAGSALGGVIEQAAASLTANGGILTVGRLVNLNMKVYKIPAETRVFKIAPETRIHKIRRTQ